MKKKFLFLIKCALVLLPFIACILYTKENLLKFSDEEIPFYIWNREFANTEHDKYYDVLFMGDSTANASFVPNILSDTSINLALGGTTIVENYYVLQDWLQNNKPPKDIFLIITDRHMNRFDTFWSRAIHSHRFSFKQNLQMVLDIKKYQEQSALVDNYISDFISYQLYLPNKYITSLMNGSINQREETNLAQMRRIEFQKGRYICPDAETFPLKDPVIHDTFTVGNIFDNYYRKFLNLCQEHGIKVHAFKMPRIEGWTYTEQYTNQVFKYYHELEEEYRNYEFNFCNEIYPAEYFGGDEIHVNTRGALQFSHFIKEQYPDQFDKEIMPEQVDNINTHLNEETHLDNIFKWVYGQDYTVILYDGTDRIETLYNEKLKYKNMELLKMLDTKGVDNENLYIISSNHTFKNEVQLLTQKEEILVHTENAADDLIWKPYNYNGISIVIIDNLHKVPICIKNAPYLEKIEIGKCE